MSNAKYENIKSETTYPQYSRWRELGSSYCPLWVLGRASLPWASRYTIYVYLPIYPPIQMFCSSLPSKLWKRRYWMECFLHQNIRLRLVHQEELLRNLSLVHLYHSHRHKNQNKSTWTFHEEWNSTLKWDHVVVHQEQLERRLGQAMLRKERIRLRIFLVERKNNRELHKR